MSSSDDTSMNDSFYFSLRTDDQIDRDIHGRFDLTEGHNLYVENYTGPPLLARPNTRRAVQAHMGQFHCCEVKVTFSDAGGLVVEVSGGELSVAGAGLSLPSKDCVKLKWCIPASSEHRPRLVHIPIDILGPDGQLQQQLSSISTKKFYPLQSMAAVVCYRMAVEILQQLGHVPGHKALVRLARRVLCSAELWVLLQQFRPSAALLVQQPAQLSRERLLTYIAGPPCAQHAAIAHPCSKRAAVDTCTLVALLHQLDPLPVGICSKAAVQQALKRLLQKYPPHWQQQALQQQQQQPAHQQQPAQQQQAEVTDAQLKEWLGLQSLELDDVVKAAAEPAIAEHAAHCCWCGETNHLIKCSSCCHEYHLSCEGYQQYSHLFSPSADLDPGTATNGKPECLACQGFPLSDKFWEYVSTGQSLVGNAGGAAGVSGATGSGIMAAARRRRPQSSADNDTNITSESDRDGATDSEADDSDPAFRPGCTAATGAAAAAVPVPAAEMAPMQLQPRLNDRVGQQQRTMGMDIGQQQPPSTPACCPADAQPLTPATAGVDAVAAAVDRGMQLIKFIASALFHHSIAHNAHAGQLLPLGMLPSSKQQPLQLDLMPVCHKHSSSNTRVLARFIVKHVDEHQQQGCQVLECCCGRRFDSLSSAEGHIAKPSNRASERLWVSGCLMRGRHSGQISPLTLKDLWSEAHYMRHVATGGTADVRGAVPVGSVVEAAATASAERRAAAAAAGGVRSNRAGFPSFLQSQISQAGAYHAAEQDHEVQQQQRRAAQQHLEIEQHQLPYEEQLPQQHQRVRDRKRPRWSRQGPSAAETNGGVGALVLVLSDTQEESGHPSDKSHTTSSARIGSLAEISTQQQQQQQQEEECQGQHRKKQKCTTDHQQQQQLQENMGSPPPQQHQQQVISLSSLPQQCHKGMPLPPQRRQGLVPPRQRQQVQGGLLSPSAMSPPPQQQRQHQEQQGMLPPHPGSPPPPLPQQRQHHRPASPAPLQEQQPEALLARQLLQQAMPVSPQLPQQGMLAVAAGAAPAAAEAAEAPEAVAAFKAAKAAEAPAAAPAVEIAEAADVAEALAAVEAVEIDDAIEAAEAHAAAEATEDAIAAVEAFVAAEAAEHEEAVAAAEAAEAAEAAQAAEALHMLAAAEAAEALAVAEAADAAEALAVAIAAEAAEAK